MIEITISKEGEVKIKVGDHPNVKSVSVSRADAEQAIFDCFKSQVPKSCNPPPPPAPKLDPDEEIIFKTDGDCKRQNICGYEPKPIVDVTKCETREKLSDKPGQLKYEPNNRLNEMAKNTMDKIFGCQSGEIEGGPAY